MIYVLSMGYNNPRIMRASLDRLFETWDLKSGEAQLIFLDAHYPLDRPEIMRLMADLRIQRGATVLDAGRNLGLNANWNWMCSQLPLQPDDILIGYDPDSWPQRRGWASALVAALRNWRETKIPWVSATTSNTYAYPKNLSPVFDLGGLRAIRPVGRHCWMQSICAFVWEPLQAIGNFAGPTEWYGELETSLHARYLAQGFDMAWLTDVGDDFKKLVTMEDPRYRRWKLKHALERSVKVDFETWIKSGAR